MSQFWLNTDGSLALNPDGSIVLDIEQPLIDCCCGEPAPCTCPCDTFPPESWPCGGLNETYDITFSVDLQVRMFTCDGCANYDCENGTLVCSETIGPYSVTVTADALCSWSGDVPSGSGSVSCPPCPDPKNWGWYDFLPVQLFLNGTSPCKWVIVMPFYFAGSMNVGGTKSVGLTPAGIYVPVEGSGSNCFYFCGIDCDYPDPPSCYWAHAVSTSIVVT